MRRQWIPGSLFPRPPEKEKESLGTRLANCRKRKGKGKKKFSLLRCTVLTALLVAMIAHTPMTLTRTPTHTQAAYIRGYRTIYAYHVPCAISGTGQPP